MFFMMSSEPATFLLHFETAVYASLVAVVNAIARMHPQPMPAFCSRSARITTYSAAEECFQSADFIYFVCCFQTALFWKGS